MASLHVINTGYFKLDGGAMFGVVPKTMWEKLNPPDNNSMCTWAMRCILVDEGDRKILIDTGMGNKVSDRMKSHFHPHGEDTLLNSLKQCGYGAEDITDVLLTHLHFDHCGGAISYNDKQESTLTFPNATYWSNELHWNWAMEPNARERASFLKENFTLIKDQGKLSMIDVQQDISFSKHITLKFAYGHTEAMMLPVINLNGKKLIYCADILPSHAHIGMPYVMSYDIRPLVTMNEKKELFDWILHDNVSCFLEHDPSTECVQIMKNERGRYRMKRTFSLSDFLT